MALPLALALAPSIIQTGMGIYQTMQGNEMKNSMDRPTYEIPQEILDSLTDAQVQALRGMPAEQKQQYIDNVMRSQQASLEAMGDRKAGLAGLAGVQQTAVDAYRNMLSMDAQQRQLNEQNLQRTRGVVAGFKDKQFDYNEAQPYDQTMAAAEGMIGSGIQNTFGGIQAGSQMGLDAVMFNQYMNGIGGSGGTNNIGGSPSASGYLPPVDVSQSTGNVNNASSVLPYQTKNQGLMRENNYFQGIYDNVYPDTNFTV